MCTDKLYNLEEEHHPPVDKETFITLATLASCDVILSTHDGLYKQVDGLAMGSPPAPHLANGWMSQFDNTIKGTSTLYTRYMDDILCECKADDVYSAKKVLGHFCFLNNFLHIHHKNETLR